MKIQFIHRAQLREEKIEIDWPELEKRIKRQIKPKSSRILKCDGIERWRVTSNNGHKIGMQIGSTPHQTKAITYEMIKLAFDTVMNNEQFNSHKFRERYKDQYEAGPCRFSMAGGILVELGVATLMPADTEDDCYYIKKP